MAVFRKAFTPKRSSGQQNSKILTRGALGKPSPGRKDTERNKEGEREKERKGEQEREREREKERKREREKERKREREKERKRERENTETERERERESKKTKRASNMDYDSGCVGVGGCGWEGG